MTTPEITVRKLSYYVPMTLLGLDEQGRQQYVCPGWGCGDTAYFDDDGRGHCPSCEPMAEAIAATLAAGVEALEALDPTLTYYSEAAGGEVTSVQRGNSTGWEG